MIYTIFKQDLRLWCLTSTIYLFVAVFSLFSLGAMFLLSGFVSANRSDLTFAFFRWHPWIYALVIPFLAMQVWSEERRSSFFELWFTKPVSMMEIVLAKFSVAAVTILLALLATFPAVLVVVLYGSPDWGRIATGYLGSFLIGCCFVALSMGVSSLLKISIGSYIASVAFCSLLIVTGMAKVRDVVIESVPQLRVLADAFMQLSIRHQYDAFLYGSIAWSSVASLLLLTAFGLFVNATFFQSERFRERL